MLCGIEWALKNSLGYMEKCGLCGIEWVVWNSVGYMEENGMFEKM